MKLKLRSKVTAAVVSLAMAFTMIPMMGAPAYADDPAPAAPGIALGSNVLSVGSNTSGAATVHMADKTWRVIGYGGKGVASSTDTMTLIAGDNLKTGVHFNPHYNAVNTYKGSALHGEVKNLTDGDNSAFSDGEKAGIVSRTLESGEYNNYKPEKTDCIVGEKVEDALLWPLSTKEAYELDDGLRRLDGGTGRNWRIDYWWLRSPGEDKKSAYVNGSGVVGDKGHGAVTEYGVRPAFNFNLESVIFTSAAVGGKSSGDVGAGSLKSVEPNSNNEWKVTLESGHDSFKVENVSTCDGKTVNIKYSGAVAKNGEYISAIVTDENDAVKYYGNLIEFADEDSTSGTAKVTIDGKMESTDKLYVFNEQLNGDKKTDYASKLIEITVPAATGHIYMWEYVNDGEHKGVCDKCGDEITEEHEYNQHGRCSVCNGACGHSSLNDSYSHNPDRHWITCAYCDTVIEDEEHTWQDEWTADETQHWYECSVCKRKKDTADHTWDAGTVKKEATCEENGVKTYTCTICNGSKNEEIPALGHDWYNDKDHITLEYFNQTVGDGGKMKCKATLTCKRDSSHTQEVYSNASIGYHDTFPKCEEPGSDVIDYSFPEPYQWLTPIAKVTTSVPPTGHKLKKTDKVDSTCTTAGTEEYWTCETKTCKKMFSDAGGKKEISKPIGIEAKGHTEAVDKAVAATCTETGLTEGKHCSVCDEILVKQNTVPAIGHNLTKTDKVDPTCTKTGTEAYWTCETCDKMFSDSDGKNEISKPIEIKAKGHTEVVDKAVPATCTETGLTEGKHCSVCDEVLVKQNTVQTTGHKWDSGKVTKKATEKAEGIKTYTCTVCKATKTEAIPKLKPSAPEVSEKLLPKMTAKKKGMTISWNKIKGAAGYDIFFARCNHDKKKIIPKKAKTIKGNKIFKWTKSKLKKGTAYKAYVKAFVYKNGKKSYVRTSPLMHSYTGNGTKKYTNAKSVSVNKPKVTLKKGKTFKIKSKVSKVEKNKKLMPKSHAVTLRYMTSNKKIATVSKSGKIKAKAKGTCYIYAYAHNGVSKRITITVK